MRGSYEVDICSTEVLLVVSSLTLTRSVLLEVCIIIIIIIINTLLSCWLRNEGSTLLHLMVRSTLS